MIDFSKCNKGLHPFIMISYDGSYSSSKVVRWCPVCGSIVIDEDYDGRTHPGYYMKLQCPQIIKAYHNKINI